MSTVVALLIIIGAAATGWFVLGLLERSES